MNFLLSFMFVVTLAIGNFFPYPEDDTATLSLKIVTICLLVLLATIYKDEKILNRKAILHIVIITLIFGISSFRTHDLVYSLDKYISCSIIALNSYILFKILESKNDFITATKYIVQAGFYILILTILYKIQFGFWQRDVRFFLNGPITFSWIAGFYLLLSVHIYKNTKQILYLFLAAIYFIAILWTQSKGGLLATIFALLFYLVYNSSRSVKIITLLLSTSLFFFKTNLLNFLADLTEGTRFSAIIRLINNDVSDQDTGSISIRQDMISEGFNLFLNNFSIGIGVGNYQFHTNYGFMYPHNAHLEVFLEFGLIVGAVYLFYLLFSFAKGSALLKSALILFIIAGSFSGDMTYLRFAFFICLLINALPKNSFNRI